MVFNFSDVLMLGFFHFYFPYILIFFWFLSFLELIVFYIFHLYRSWFLLKMTSVIRKPIKRFVPILKNYYFLSSNSERSYSSYYVQKQIDKMKLVAKKGDYTTLRSVSSSNLSQSNDSNGNNPKDEQQKNMLDDPEMRSILSDFAKDFDVGSDSEQVLDEIRKNLDESVSKQKSSDDKSSCSLQQSKESNISLKEKFKEFSDTDSAVIPSYEELQSNKDNVYCMNQETESASSTEVTVKRGIHGVYDIEEMIDVLKKENSDDIVAISVPKELHYTDYLVIVTAKSPRHSEAICERVIKLYKLKKHTKDPFVIVEGEKSPDWKVIDMGNIVLHIFLEETRALYDIESLWLLDSAFDRGGNLKDDPMYSAIEQQMEFFNLVNEALSSNSKGKTI